MKEARIFIDDLEVQDEIWKNPAFITVKNITDKKKRVYLTYSSEEYGYLRMCQIESTENYLKAFTDAIT